MRIDGPSSGMGGKKKARDALDVPILLTSLLLPSKTLLPIELQGVFRPLPCGVISMWALLRLALLITDIFEKARQIRPSVASPPAGIGALSTGASHSILLPRDETGDAKETLLATDIFDEAREGRPKSVV